MATTKQEQIYNEIIKYYDFADQLLGVIDNTRSETLMEIVENIVNDLEKHTDHLSNKFIELMKEGTSKQLNESIKNTFNNIITEIDEYRNHICSAKNNQKYQQR